MKDFDITNIDEDELFDMFLTIAGFGSETDFEINQKETLIMEIEGNTKE